MQRLPTKPQKLRLLPPDMNRTNSLHQMVTCLGMAHIHHAARQAALTV